MWKTFSKIRENTQIVEKYVEIQILNIGPIRPCNAEK